MIELTLISQTAENKKGLRVGGAWENTKMWGPKPRAGAPVKKCIGTMRRGGNTKDGSGEMKWLPAEEGSEKAKRRGAGERGNLREGCI